MGVSEGFENSQSDSYGDSNNIIEEKKKLMNTNSNDCEPCKKFEFNWIVLLLIVIVLLMTIIIYNVI